MEEFDLDLLYDLIAQRRRKLQIPVNKANVFFGISDYARKEARRNEVRNGFTLEEFLIVCDKLKLEPIKLLQIAKKEKNNTD